jgi:hypothetical protein
MGGPRGSNNETFVEREEPSGLRVREQAHMAHCPHRVNDLRAAIGLPQCADACSTAPRGRRTDKPHPKNCRPQIANGCRAERQARQVNPVCSPASRGANDGILKRRRQGRNGLKHVQEWLTTHLVHAGEGANVTSRPATAHLGQGS